MELFGQESRKGGDKFFLAPALPKGKNFPPGSLQLTSVPFSATSTVYAIR